MGLLGGRSETAEALVQDVPGCPDAANHYVTYVHRGYMKMENFRSDLNGRYQQGYRLSKAFEQGGNTVLVYEHNHP